MVFYRHVCVVVGAVCIGNRVIFLQLTLFMKSDNLKEEPEGFFFSSAFSIFLSRLVFVFFFFCCLWF